LSDLASDLRARLTGRTCVVGVGNPELGDDGVGVDLAEGLRDSGCPDVLVAGTEPERWLDHMTREAVDHVLLLDAAEFAGEPGSVVLMDARDIRSRFPQVSTHKLSLGTLAAYVECRAETKVWLLGVKPASLRPGAGLSEPVRRTRETLLGVLCDVLQPLPAAQPECESR
jgi:hydrogenase maturation protease